MTLNQITYRSEAKLSDLNYLEGILASSGFFHSYEIVVAKELLEYRLEDGDEDEDGYHYIFADDNDKMVGFIAFSFEACTLHTYYLYWFAVHDDYRGKGIGKILLQKFEDYVVAHGGKKIVMGTSGRDIYKPTRDFYEKQGYHESGIIPDYYAIGDANITYVKDVGM